MFTKTQAIPSSPSSALSFRLTNVILSIVSSLPSVVHIPGTKVLSLLISRAIASNAVSTKLLTSILTEDDEMLVDSPLVFDVEDSVTCNYTKACTRGEGGSFVLRPPSSLFPLLPSSLFHLPSSLFLFLLPYSLFPLPSSLFPLPSSFFPLPSSRFPLPSSLFLLPYSEMKGGLVTFLILRFGASISENC
jgi:hypothetical protein